MPVRRFNLVFIAQKSGDSSGFGGRFHYHQFHLYWLFIFSFTCRCHSYEYIETILNCKKTSLLFKFEQKACDALKSQARKISPPDCLMRPLRIIIETAALA